jgi:hypothetical protein
MASITPSQNTPVFAEHAPHRDAADRGQLLAEEIGKGVAGNHA